MKGLVKRVMNMHKSLKNTIFLCLSLFVLPVAADMQTPDVLARTVTEEVLAIVRADKDLQNGNQNKVAQLVETKILPHFNFTRMTQLAMSRNWRQSTADQQKLLVSEFQTLLVRTYTAAFTQYRNETVSYRPVRMAPDDRDVMVRSQINRPGGPPVGVDYSMERTGQGWKVYDVKIEGISLVENYRNTFNSEVQKNGVDGLIRTLSERNRQLSQQAQAGRK